MKINKVCCCWSLSQGCFLFGILGLAMDIFVILVYSKPEHKTSDIMRYKNISMLVVAVIDALTCSLMMYGSKMKCRELLLPHLVWEIIFIGLIGSVAFEEIIMSYLHEKVLLGLTLSAVMCCVLPLYVYYWNVIHNRYMEIKRKQSTPPNLIEMK